MRVLRPILAIALSAFAVARAAAPADAPAAADPRAELAAKLGGGVKAEELHPSPVAGLYELARGAEVTYVSADGRYLITGDLYQVAKTGTWPNLSDERRRDLRAKLLAALPETQMVVFAPPLQAKYTVTVFTDPDCPWCRKLHSQIAEYNRLGIKVRYAFFPREGPGSEAWIKLEQVWCSPDRKDALTRAKLGQDLKAPKCAADAVVRRSWELGHQIGVESTPNIVLESGELIPGYLPPQQLLAKLAPSQAKTAVSQSAPPASLAR